MCVRICELINQTPGHMLAKKEVIHLFTNVVMTQSWSGRVFARRWLVNTTLINTRTRMTKSLETKGITYRELSQLRIILPARTENHHDPTNPHHQHTHGSHQMGSLPGMQSIIGG